MLGDRNYGSPSSRVNFLGGTAAFPIGAYVLAAIADAPLIPVFNLRERGGHYRFFGFPALHPKMPAHHLRDAYLKNCATGFAQNLEIILKRDPLQWYNFYPFWEKSEPPAQSKPQLKTCLMSVAIENLIPHRAPMRFIDALVECTETAAVATVCFGADSFAVADGLVLETALVECVAQTVAAALGWRAKNSSQSDFSIATKGMLVAVSNFKIHARTAAGKILRIEVRELKRLGLMLRVAAEIFCDGQPVASGELTLYA
jgi:predicted hotdog family 3-hydroxylacyl-ACP dehydratase